MTSLRQGRFRWLVATAVAAPLLAAAACATNPPPSDNAYCAQLFDQYDGFLFLPTPSPPGYDFIQMQLSRIRQAQCLTLTRNLAPMDAAAASAAPRVSNGPLLRWRPAVQAGVVTNPGDEARALAYFQHLGYRARSLGAPRLGTRIYVEPLTAGDIQNIITAAQRAGFVGPYPSRFVTF